MEQCQFCWAAYSVHCDSLLTGTICEWQFFSKCRLNYFLKRKEKKREKNILCLPAIFDLIVLYYLNFPFYFEYILLTVVFIYISY